MAYKLFEHQEKGVEFLTTKRACLLGFFCGGGKSLTSIIAAEKLFKEKKIDNVLVVVPGSLKMQWFEEFHKFIDEEICLCYGTNKGIKGKSFKDCIKLKTKQDLFRMMSQTKYNIVSYDFVMDNFQSMQNLINYKNRRWVTIGDEITKIKNFRSKRSKALKKLKTEYRWGLSGKLIENKAEEAFSLMQWINPLEFGKFTDFDRRYIVREWFGGVKEYKNLDELRQKISPYILRRKKTEVKGLPEVLTQERPIEFNQYEISLYNKVVEDILYQHKDLLELKKWKTSSNAYEEENNKIIGIMSQMMVLRQICDDSRILISKFCKSSYGQSLSELIKDKSSSKMQELESLLEEILEDKDNKVIVFSSYVGAISFIEEMLNKKGVGFARIHSTFNEIMLLKEGKVRVGLFSDKAAYGTDCPFCNYVINLDLPFNPAILEQRSSRIQRISSKFKCVSVINFYVLHSLEERILNIISDKERLSEEILSSIPLESNVFKFTTGKLKQFLIYNKNEM